MNKKIIAAAFSAALVFASASSFADEMENCEVSVNGKNFVKEGTSVSVPAGACAKILSGDLEGMDQAVLDGIDTEGLKAELSSK
jgi:hypothetical protein